MESEGYIPSDAEKFTASSSRQENQSTESELPTEAIDLEVPAILPLPEGNLMHQLQEMNLPDNSRRALVARTQGLEDVSRMLPDSIMSVPGMGEQSLTQALDALAKYGIHPKTPSQDDPTHTLGLDHNRNRRLKGQGVETVGQLLDLLRDNSQSLDPADAGVISRRLKQVGLVQEQPPAELQN